MGIVHVQRIDKGVFAWSIADTEGSGEIPQPSKIICFHAAKIEPSESNSIVSQIMQDLFQEDALLCSF